MTIYEPTEALPQRTEGWFEARIGKITASRARAAMDFTKTGKEGAERRRLRRALVAERITGKPQEVFVTAAMQRGTDLEPEARDAYSALTGRDVNECGFYAHPTIENCGASPDGVMGGDGLLEIKCPSIETHIGYIEDGVVPEDYRPQMLLQMACTGRAWVDFFSYCPGLPSFLIRFERDEVAIKELEAAIQKIDAEVDELVTKIVGDF